MPATSATARVRRMASPSSDWPSFLALPCLIDGEPPQDHDGDRIGHVPPDPARNLGAGDRTGSKAEIAHDPALGAHDVGVRCSFALVVQRPALQPVVEGGDAGVEHVSFVVGREPLGLGGQAFHTGLLARRERSAGMSLAGASSRR